MPPFRIFVSSPVDGIAEYRAEIIRAARCAVSGGTFEFFFYEQQDIECLPGQTVSEAVFAASGNNFDALFVFFKDYIGDGTLDEFDFFKNTVIKLNPRCEIWWSQIFCQNEPQNVRDFKAQLLGISADSTGSLGLPIVAGGEINDEPWKLAGRFTSKLFGLAARLRSSGHLQKPLAKGVLI